MAPRRVQKLPKLCRSGTQNGFILRVARVGVTLAIALVDAAALPDRALTVTLMGGGGLANPQMCERIRGRRPSSSSLHWAVQILRTASSHRAGLQLAFCGPPGDRTQNPRIKRAYWQLH